MHVETQAITVTTDASGDATVYSRPITGLISSVRYVKTDFAAGVDFTITLEDTGRGLWTEDNVNASKTVAPRQPTHDLVGAASLYAGAGEGVEDKIALAKERIKIVIANGGDTKTGVFHVTVIGTTTPS